MADHFLLMQTTAQAMSGSTGKAVASFRPSISPDIPPGAAWTSSTPWRRRGWRHARALPVKPSRRVLARGRRGGRQRTIRRRGVLSADGRAVRGPFACHSTARAGQARRGPRVGVVRRFAVASRAEDGAELASVSRDFEDLGDLVAAADASAYAAIHAVAASANEVRRWVPSPGQTCSRIGAASTPRRCVKPPNRFR